MKILVVEDEEAIADALVHILNKNKYRILHSNCLTHIMHYKNIDYLDKIDYYKSIGIKSFRLELLDEDYNETIKLINNIKNK